MTGNDAAPLTFAVRGPIGSADVPGLCLRIRTLLASSRATRALCNVEDAGCDAATVDALARLQLEAGRNGCRVLLCNASSDLLDLIAFMGLEEVLRC